MKSHGILAISGNTCALEDSCLVFGWCTYAVISELQDRQLKRGVTSFSLNGCNGEYTVYEVKLIWINGVFYPQFSPDIHIIMTCLHSNFSSLVFLAPLCLQRCFVLKLEKKSLGVSNYTTF